MALIHLDHMPQTTQVCQPLNIILPDPGRMNGVPVRQRKVLYLLHGLSDDGSAWQRFTSIETLANDYGLVVVMPSVARSFYTDQLNGQRYFSYIVEELPQYLSDVFNLVPRREDTFIAGLSMGGYGAVKAGLLHPELYSAVASFSGVLTLNGFDAHVATEKKLNEFAYIFGDLSKLPGSEYDPAVWLKQASAHPAALPKLFVACGRQDDLNPMSQYFSAECQRLNVAVDYYEEDGGHEWYFWDRQIYRFLKAVLGENPNVKR
jgi:S-formylglutathione hydrolase FrmB